MLTVVTLLSSGLTVLALGPIERAAKWLPVYDHMTSLDHPSVSPVIVTWLVSWLVSWVVEEGE